MPSITPLQLKLARAATGLGVRDLAAVAGVSPSTVQRFEGEKGGMQARTLDKVQQALEERGVIFVAADASAGPGVRMKL